MSKHVIGLVLIDAPHSALNNAGLEDTYSSAENKVVVKIIRKGKSVYPYVSGQAWRNWWRSTLQQSFKEWKNSPIERRSDKTVVTEVDPVEYDDDDIFGYMRTKIKKAKNEKDKETFTRLSPLKCSPLISIEPQQPTNDFGVMARQEGDPFPYEHQFYATVLKGIFSLDLSAVGTFWDINKTGYKNISRQYVEKIKKNGGQQIDEKSPWVLTKEVRIKRSKDTIKALSVISGGAKLTSHLTDVTPKLIVLGIIEGGNHPFMNLMVEKEGKGEFSVQALKQVIDDYSDRLVDNIFIGKRKGFMDELDTSFEQLSKDNSKVVYGSPNEVIDQLSENLEKHID